MKPVLSILLPALFSASNNAQSPAFGEWHQVDPNKSGYLTLNEVPVPGKPFLIGLIPMLTEN